MKKCTNCKTEYPLTRFYKSIHAKDGLSPWCIECFCTKVRGAYLKRTYGITLDQYNELLESQGNCCAICGKNEDSLTKYNRNKSLAVDHNHNTGKIRGILCENCNRGIGLLQSDVQIIQNAIDYLNLN